jgi:two-component system alkaline phosphatase synthesis response regulator PhoP
MTEIRSFKVLVVDDEVDIIEFVSYNLRKEGYEVYTAMNGEQALEVARAELPDLILLDVMMPEKDGIETCQEMRAIPELNRTIIAFLTARGEDYSQIAGFEAGADDYIGKPIRPKVLLSRIKALLKRSLVIEPLSLEEEAGILTVGHLIIDQEKYLVTCNGEPLSLPKKEFELLILLLSKPEKVFTREEIYNSIWGEHIIVGDRTIDVHIRKLREKIGQDHIVTIKGVGYKFVL